MSWKDQNNVMESPAAAQSFQERLVESYAARDCLEGELERAVIDKNEEILRLQQNNLDLQEKLEYSERERERKFGDARSFEKDCQLLRSDATTFENEKTALRKEVEALKEELAVSKAEVASLEKRKGAMFKKLQDSKEDLEKARLEMRNLEMENEEIKQEWKQVGRTMTSFTETWKGREQEQAQAQEMASSEERAWDNAATAAAISPQIKRWAPQEPQLPSSPITPPSNARRQGTITRRIKDEEEPEVPNYRLKQKDGTTIQGYTVVREHFRKVSIKKP